MLARQYYTEGYYPSGTKHSGPPRTPSGALLKATLLNSAHYPIGTTIDYPNDTEGWGVVSLDRALRFPGSLHQLLVSDVRNASGLTAGQETSFAVPVMKARRFRSR